jgi:hypothetical protein
VRPGSAAWCGDAEPCAGRLPQTRFLKVNAERAPFLCERLRIWMMPTIVLVKSGVTEHSIVGFDELGSTDDFTTEAMETVLVNHGLLLESFC